MPADMSSPEIPHHLNVGSRIQVQHSLGTVRFIGTVENTKGVWLGVEWDDASRGKHDGSHQGIRYFHCSVPGSGSFIRYHPEKVRLGCTFMEALTSKYLEEDTSEMTVYDPESDKGQLYFGGNKQIKVETVGFGKIQRQQRQLHKLQVVGLAGQEISSAGVPGIIREAALNIVDLDLSRNLVADWHTIADIASQLPSLKILRLNQSRLQPPPNDVTVLYREGQSPFATLTTLVLNHTGVQWSEIEQLAPLLQPIEDLQLAGNDIRQLSSVSLPHLKCINFEHNKLDNWTQVVKLGNLPSLETLFLNNNTIPSVDIPEPGAFPQLQFLRLDSNAIQNWTSFDALNAMPSLTKLRCKHNPIFKDLPPEHATSQVVGRIKKLTVVDGNTLVGRERSDFERFYLKLCAKDGDTHETIAKIHPRYTELCKLHGEPDLQSSANSGTRNTLLTNRLISITFTRRPINSEAMLVETKKRHELPLPTLSIEKKVLPTMMIRNVRNIIQKLLHIPASQQQLYLLQSSPMDGETFISMELSDNLRDLKFYSVAEGDEITVLTNV
ncbi:uncharacterized protein BYT42DRAFT_201605 [Radiomyces spectabilis]|uniref:uncharacterized protein n=1 Tax=Radiomyces spectabilis TaxID=64574 RepID=UPI00222065F9|nr:uncharacterized protein BYT42DRAFT_201605 [Radiomyces spectabilis]KAI8391617.1 hypothetical protein BYT42DRAFT_201605 [Radiomyces spectabilis]